MKRSGTIIVMTYSVLVMLLTAAPGVYGQRSALSNAAQNAARNQFIDASEIYAGVFTRGNRDAALSAGDNLYRARRYSEALPYFRYADSLAMIKDPETVFQYFECLKSEKRYEEADALVKKNLAEYAGRREFQLSDNRLEYYKKIESFKGARLKRLNMNSRFSDISPTVYGDWLYFVSTRVATNNKDVHRINMQPFYNLYAIPQSEVEGIYTDADLSGQVMKGVVMPKGSFGKKEQSIRYGSVTASSLPNGINKKHHDGPIFAAPSGSMLFFTTNWSDKKRPKTKPLEINLLIYYIEKSGDTWSQPKGVPFNSFKHSNQHAYYDQGSSTLYFSSNMPGGQGGFDIWKSVLSNGSWSAPQNLGPMVNTPKEEVFPALTPDGRLIFSSNGWPGLGGLDLFLSDMGSEPVNLLAGMNTEKDDFNLIFTNPQGGYLVSNRSSSVGDDDIYSFELDLKQVVSFVNEVPERLITGLVKDAQTGEILTGVKVSVSGAFGRNYTTAGTSPVGETVKGSAGDPGAEIVVRYEKEGYEPAELRFKGWPMDQKILDISKQLVKVKPQEIAEVRDIKNPAAPVAPATPKPGVPAGPAAVAADPVKAGGPLKEFIIYFDFDKYYIRKPDAWGTLEECLAYVTKEFPDTKVELVGHTDSRAPLAYNVTLSTNRVETTKKWLASRGVDASRMSTSHEGEVNPAVPCPDPSKDPDTCLNEKQHQLNRRVTIKVRY